MQEIHPRPSGNIRWVICALLFFATTINYIDRVTISVLEPELRKVIGDWNDGTYGHINGFFMIAYAFGSLAAGWMMDKLGTRLGFTIALIFWSFVAASHALARNITEFSIARFALGIGESANFPGAIKTVAVWFPKKERALATGIFNSGTNIGAILAPLIIQQIVLRLHWQAAFIITGLAGLIWVLFWWPMYREPTDHPKLSPDELAYIESDPQDKVAKVPWLELLPFRQTWAFAIGKFLTDAIWWFYLFWFPRFMADKFHLDIKTIGIPMALVYVMATIGSVTGGWQSMWLLKRGFSPNAARKLAMLTCALCVVPVTFAESVSSQWAAVFLIGLATAAHQGFSANLFTLTSDMFPRPAVGSVTGIGQFTGAMGGALLQFNAGTLKEITGNYTVLFAIAGSAYLLALLIIHLLVPKMEPVVLAPATT